MPFRRTSIDSNQRTGFYSPKLSRVVGSRFSLSFSISAISYTQSSVYAGITPVSNAIMTDGSFANTGAATNNGSGQFVQMDLGGVFSVDRVVIGTATSLIPGGWSKFYTENRTVQHSLDNTTWTDTFNTGTFSTNGIYTFNVNITARYLRIIDKANSWIAISEFYALPTGF